ncbi:helix-turn-helix domain-containing protein [Candidatus Nomurabacteria bacterium]|nr:helix-turn-helix domain-containing protein [Candidatus Nomurabacteria bacterium]
MARLEDREKAITLRLKGHSYSQIKEALGISKSTLHYWLVDYPLSEERIRELRDHNAQRIERFRENFRQKKIARKKIIRQKVLKEIGKVSERELLIAGFFLYWAEGMKVDRGTVLLTNTDPAMLRFFLAWLGTLGVDRKKLKARLHLYSDMEVDRQIKFWATELNLPVSIFKNTYIKKSDSNKRRNYRGRFGHGTCAIWTYNQELYEKIMMAIDGFKEKYCV